MAVQAQHFHEPHGNRVVQAAAVFVGVVLLLTLVWYVYSALTSVSGVKVDSTPPTVTNLLPPPPPPPPPPKEVQEKPPEPTDKPSPSPEPAPTPDKPAPAPMQINGPAQAGSDSYGMSSGTGGGMGAPASTGTCVGANCGKPAGGINDGFYTRYLAGALQQAIQANSKVNRSVFSADFAISLNGSGQVTGVQMLQSSGDSKRDQLLAAILQAIGRLDPPPASMRFPQRITVRGRKAF